MAGCASITTTSSGITSRRASRRSCFYTDNRTWLAAPDLKPETVRSVEAVLEQRLGAHRVSVSAFRSWWNDLVMTVQVNPDQQTYANASHVDSYGLNAGFEGSALAKRLRYGATLTWAHSRQDSSGGEATLLPAAAQVFGNARASYELGGGLPVLALAARFVGPRPISGTNFSPVPDAGTQVELHGAVSGPISGGLSYQFTGTWALSDAAAYAVGPLRDPQPGYASQAVLPLPRFQVWAGLRYDR